MADKVYRAVNGAAKNESYMIKANDSAPGSCPEERMNKSMAEVGCAGVYANTGPMLSDKQSMNRAAGVKKQLSDKQY